MSYFSKRKIRNSDRVFDDGRSPTRFSSWPSFVDHFLWWTIESQDSESHPNRVCQWPRTNDSRRYAASAGICCQQSPQSRTGLDSREEAGASPSKDGRHYTMRTQEKRFSMLQHRKGNGKTGQVTKISRGNHCGSMYVGIKWQQRIERHLRRRPNHRWTFWHKRDIPCSRGQNRRWSHMLLDDRKKDRSSGKGSKDRWRKLKAPERKDLYLMSKYGVCAYTKK